MLDETINWRTNCACEIMWYVGGTWNANVMRTLHLHMGAGSHELQQLFPIYRRTVENTYKHTTATDYKNTNKNNNNKTVATETTAMCKELHMKIWQKWQNWEEKKHEERTKETQNNNTETKQVSFQFERATTQHEICIWVVQCNWVVFWCFLDVFSFYIIRMTEHS